MTTVRPLICIFSLFALISAKVSYENYRVYKFVPENDIEVEKLNYLNENGNLQFWTDTVVISGDVRIMVPPEQIKQFEEYVEENNLDGEMVIENVQEIIDRQMKKATGTNMRNTRLGSYNWDRYHSLEEIYNWLDELERTYPDIVTVVVIGKTLEDREIKGVIIDYQEQNREEKLVGMLEGGIHAREWISVETITWIIKEFLTGSDENVRTMARNFVWHIFPVVNPDGYSYTFTDNRMWRKNRNTAYAKTCDSAHDDMSNGVDLNRNFDFVWMTEGARNDSCENMFAGPHPFSEFETLAIANYVTRINNTGKLMYYLAFHSYTQLILIPYSNLGPEDALQVDNFGDLYEMGIRGADAIRRRYGIHYRVGLSYDHMYKMSGTSFDWVRQETNVPICYLLELRDMGVFGFLLEPEQIIPNNLEIMDGLLEMDSVAKRMGYYSGASSFPLSFAILVSTFSFLVLFY